MKKKLFGAIALVAMLAAPALAEAATRGFATANVNMRSGPSTAYPAVVVIPNGAPLTVHGCLSDTPWCDVSFVGGRGWVAGRYIATTYRQNRVYVEPRYYRDLGVPVITFEVGRYWDRYYRDRDFYRERDRWRRPPPSGGYWNAPPPSAGWDRPRPRDEWRDGRRDDWRDGRRDEWRDPRQGGPNDGRWERRYGDWNQGDRNQDRPRRDDDRRRFEDENRDRNRQFNQDDGQRRPERRVQPEEQRRPEGRAPSQEQVRPPEPAPRSYRACDPADTECLSRQ
ncbi:MULTISPECIES: SH3 domain-containing protein [Rhizobium/Agrobacterium group]|uniref:SH3 domain-containing protein n=1 Tax=Rhizobium/Agrobacterium group TaxID=227290 RepID=UPI0010CB55B6|nr:SH3 domain-containing protein [Rhizobium sp. AU243]NTB98899.1 SH3 domain-containing protein [Agrobacterium tumefaciens]NTC45576.1 SH3 domain-containing protein [Agrobacterium tumefaciens]TKV73236.1 SH3 domain-containing protein [Rhizobium sp. AU243]